MKTTFRIAAGLVAAIVVIAVAVYGFINFSPIPSYPVETVEFRHHPSPEALERGEMLVTTLCASCHMNPETRTLIGQHMLEVPPEFGKIYSPNITQDKTYGIGDWTDGELVFLLRTGIKRDGQYAPPYMAKLPHLADEDMNAIISFLRSDHRIVAADPTPDTPPKPGFLTKMLSRVAWKPFPMPDHPIEMPDTNNSIEHGRYLAFNLECFSCHSADFKTNDFMHPEQSKGFFGGGNKPLDREGRVKYTQNLTPHATGIGDWTKDQFIRAVKYGQKDGEPALSYPMLPYSRLTDREAGAIYDYLMTIPPIDNDVERSLY